MARMIRGDFRQRPPSGRKFSRMILLAGSIVLTLALIASLLWQYRPRPIQVIDPRPVHVSDPGQIQVIDGDTIRMGFTVYRLVGFDAPETGRNAQCDREQKLGNDATRRLRQLVTQGGLSFTRVPCACRPGTEGTRECNYGRLCGTLESRGRDVGNILISEGLARSYVCSGTRCPQRGSWC